MERLLQKIFAAVTWVTVLVSVSIVIILATKSFEFFKQISPLDFLFSTEWVPQAYDVPSFGIFPLLNGTLLIMAIAMLIAVPIGLLAAIYLSEFCGKATRGIIKPLIELIAGIPTVVFGYFAIVFMAPSIKSIADSLGIYSSLENALTAGIVMGIMITPYIISLIDDILREVPAHHREASMALGATKTETIVNALLPAAKAGIISVIMLAISRAIGETMIVTMSAGLTPQITMNPFESVTTITSQIVALLSGDQAFDSPQTLSAFALAASLFLITFYINYEAQKVLKNFQENFR